MGAELVREFCAYPTPRGSLPAIEKRFCVSRMEVSSMALSSGTRGKCKRNCVRATEVCRLQYKYAAKSAGFVCCAK